jgi:hypothetical protein
MIQGMKNPNVTVAGEDFIGPGAREVQTRLSLDGVSVRFCRCSARIPSARGCSARRSA